jgi:hypothetical protein
MGTDSFTLYLFADHRVSNCIKVKVKFAIELATKAQRRSRGVAVLFL